MLLSAYDMACWMSIFIQSDDFWSEPLKLTDFSSPRYFYSTVLDVMVRGYVAIACDKEKKKQNKSLFILISLRVILKYNKLIKKIMDKEINSNYSLNTFVWPQQKSPFTFHLQPPCLNKNFKIISLSKYIPYNFLNTLIYHFFSFFFTLIV